MYQIYFILIRFNIFLVIIGSLIFLMLMRIEYATTDLDFFKFEYFLLDQYHLSE